MTKGEIFLFDTCLIGPVALLLNQYFSYIIPELIVLVASLVIIIESDLQQSFHFMIPWPFVFIDRARLGVKVRNAFQLRIGENLKMA